MHGVFHHAKSFPSYHRLQIESRIVLATIVHQQRVLIIHIHLSSDQIRFHYFPICMLPLEPVLDER